MLRTLHNDAKMFRAMTAWAADQPEHDWHPIKRDPVHAHSVVSSDLPPFGTPVFLRYPSSIGTGSLTIDAAKCTWLGIGVGANDGSGIQWPDAWMGIPD